MFGFSVWELSIILLIVILLFGSKRLGNLGEDLGSAIRGFRGAIGAAEEESAGGADLNRRDERGDRVS